MKRNRRMPERANSSMMYSTTGLRPRGSISLGWLLVKGHNRVPRPATGMTARSTIVPICTSSLKNHSTDDNRDQKVNPTWQVFLAWLTSQKNDRGEISN